MPRSLIVHRIEMKEHKKVPLGPIKAGSDLLSGRKCLYSVPVVTPEMRESQGSFPRRLAKSRPKVRELNLPTGTGRRREREGRGGERGKSSLFRPDLRTCDFAATSTNSEPSVFIPRGSVRFGTRSIQIR
jgi:hypothetical protein